MRVCLIESFFGGSHRAWAEGYAEQSRHEVVLLNLPDENWRWRMRGAAVVVADAARALAERGWGPDVLLVSDMIDLGLLRSLLDPVWGTVPAVLYMHENQLMYPSQQGTDPTFGFLNWTSALVADEVWFNSRFHLEGFLDAVPRLLDRFPDGPHDPKVDTIRRKSVVAPVGVDLGPFDPGPRGADAPVVLWNHRWEHDKRPARFSRAVTTLLDEGLDFEVVIAGEEPIGGDTSRSKLERRLGDRLRWSGHADRETYVDLVRSSDVVVSTADHEFFGIAMVEAMAAAVCPVLPDRLSYPELVPGEFHDDVLYRDGGLVDHLRTRIVEIEATRDIGRRIAPTMGRFGWPEVLPTYDAGLERVVLRGKTS